jgi:Family of unknown function (DUF6131)
VIILGVILLIVAALVPSLSALWGVGIIVLVIGVILEVLGMLGHSVAGRRRYY